MNILLKNPNTGRTKNNKQEITATSGQTVFTLDFIPAGNSLLAFVQGILNGEGTDYTLSGKAVTFVEGIRSNRKVLFFYAYND